MSLSELIGMEKAPAGIKIYRPGAELHELSEFADGVAPIFHGLPLGKPSKFEREFLGQPVFSKSNVHCRCMFVKTSSTFGKNDFQILSTPLKL
jgi:hypothetical protein